MASSRKKKAKSDRDPITDPFKRGEQVIFSQDHLVWGIGEYKEHEREDDDRMGIEYIPTDYPHRIMGWGWFRHCLRSKGVNLNSLTIDSSLVGQ